MANFALIADLQKQFADNPRRVFARLANEHRKAGDFESAIKICRAQIPQQPGYISGHIVLGQALYESGQLNEAHQAFEAALGLDPENLIALRHLGDIARNHGEVDAARGWYQRLLEVDPQNEEVTTLLEAMKNASAASAAPEDTAPRASTAQAIAFVDSLGVGATTPPSASKDTGPSAGVAPKAVAESERIDIEKDDHFTPSTAGTTPKAIPELEQSVEITAELFMTERPPPASASPGDAAPAASAAVEARAIEPPADDSSRAAAQALFGDMVLSDHPVPPPAASPARKAEEPRDAVDFYSPMLDQNLEAPSPAQASAFVTETMAELYLQQGYTEEALNIYRQLVQQSPSDQTLRDRVTQLEQGARSSIGIAAVSDEVIAAAQKRHTTRPTRTIRNFFGRLAARRVGFGSLSSRNDAAAEGLKAPAPASPRAPSPPTGVEDFEILPPSEPEYTVPGGESRGGAAGERRAAPPNEIPEETSNQLFPGAPVAEADEIAAQALAGAFAPEYAESPPAATHPTRAASSELSLDDVFSRTPTGSDQGSPRRLSAFDEFYDDRATVGRLDSGNARAGDDEAKGRNELELFNAWLEGLKK